MDVVVFSLFKLPKCMVAHTTVVETHGQSAFLAVIRSLQVLLDRVLDVIVVIFSGDRHTEIIQRPFVFLHVQVGPSTEIPGLTVSYKNVR